MSSIERDYGLVPLDSKNAPIFDGLTVLEVYGHCSDAGMISTNAYITALDGEQLDDAIGTMIKQGYQPTSSVNLCIHAWQDGNSRGYLYLVTVQLDEMNDINNLLEFLND